MRSTDSQNLNGCSIHYIISVSFPGAGGVGARFFCVFSQNRGELFCSYDYKIILYKSEYYRYTVIVGATTKQKENVANTEGMQ